MRLASVITLNNSQFNRSAVSSRKQVAALGGGIVRMLGPLAALAAGGLSVAAGWAAAKKSIGAAAEFEDFEASFVTLLGSVDAAEQRLDELEQFGTTTPFELPGVVKASKVLESLTQGTLSTGKGLTLVGDVAASADQPIEELAVHIGRLYDGLQTGRAVGESLARLQELGLISGETRTQIEKLQAEGAKGDQVWGLAEAALGRFSGEMDRRSSTWNGMMSNFKDGIDAAFRAFGAPVIDELKPVLAGAIGQTETLEATAARFGENVAAAIRMLRGAASENGLGTLFAQSLMLAGAEFINEVARGWYGIVRGVIGALITGIDSAGEIFHASLLTAAHGFSAEMLRVMAGAATEVGADDTAASLNAAARRQDAKQSGSALLRDLLSGIAIDDMRAAFENGMADADGFELIDTTGMKAELKGLSEYFSGLITPAGDTPDDGSNPAVDEPPPAGVNDVAGTVQRIAADRLARIGGFVGGTGPSTDHARRTSDNTRKTTQLLDKTNEHLARLVERSTGTSASAWE